MTDSVLLSRFDTNVQATPDHMAFELGDKAMSYREFAELTQGFRDAIDARCAADEQCVAVLATQRIETYAAIVAIMATGRAYVPLNPRAPVDRNASCLAQSGARTIICDAASPAVESWAAALRVRPLLTGDCAPSPWKRLATVSADSMAYLLFTSGSTGVPKGVPIYHRNVNAFLDAVLEGTDWHFSSSDRVLQMFDLTFDLSVMSYAVPLCVGAVCIPVPDGGSGFVSVARTLQKARVTVALMVPSVLSFLERYFDELQLDDLRLSMFCGEALPVRLARLWWSCAPNARLLNVYGPTEATIFLSAYELSREQDEREAYNGVVSIGTPLAGSSFRVVDDTHVAVPDGEKGELILFGHQVTSGYWRNPEKTASAFIALPDGVAGYRSGDLAFARDGMFFYAGRIDHQLKIDGYRVEAGEIEHAARSHEGVRDATLVPQSIDGRVIALLLFILVDKPSADGSMGRDVRASIATRLPTYMVPQKVIERASFPLNANGKVDRKALADEARSS